MALGEVGCGAVPDAANRREQNDAVASGGGVGVFVFVFVTATARQQTCTVSDGGHGKFAAAVRAWSSEGVSARGR
jgi:hypothetical protein